MIIVKQHINKFKITVIIMSIIDDAIDYVKKIFENDYSGHDVFHTLRVYKTATNIACKEKADILIVQLASLLHDVDDKKLSPLTYEHKDKTIKFLESHKVDEIIINRICTIIDEVSFAGKDTIVPSSIEGKCVQDADRLDAIGAIGIARAFAYGGSHNREFYLPDIEPKKDMNKEEYSKHISTTVNHFYEKLFLLKDMMNTQTAKTIAEHRDRYMKSYLSEFMAEWNGKC